MEYMECSGAYEINIDADMDNDGLTDGQEVHSKAARDVFVEFLMEMIENE